MIATMPYRQRAIRRTAAILLAPSVLLVLGPLTVLLATGARPGPELSVGLVVAALPVLTPPLLWIAGRRWDPLLLSPAWVLCALGLMVIARVQPGLLPMQLLWITIGWSAFIALAGFPPLLSWLRDYRYVWLSAALLLTLSTLFLGDDTTGQGTRIWLRVGPISVQPAEVLRVALIVFLAAELSARTELLAQTWRRVRSVPLPSPEQWGGVAAAVGLAVALVFVQGDFGPALIFVGVFVAMAYLATGRRDYVLGAVGFFVVAALAVLAVSSRIQGRIDAWLNPWADPQGAGYQSLQAIGGFVFGGVAGAGPGYGYPGLIPAAHTDYPLAVLGEEWGLLGALAVVLLYGLLIARGLARAQLAGGRFAQLLGAGLALSLGLQVLVVFGGVLRLLPLTGITSPFLSYGGSSMLMSWAMLAMLLRVGGREGDDGDDGDERGAPLPAMADRTRLVGLALLGGFVVLAGTLGYWQVVRAGDLAADPGVSGRRLRLEGERITRGRLLDRNGEVLAETAIGPDGTPRRVYHQAGAVHVVGFDSAWLGSAGAEAVAGDALMGRRQLSPWDTIRDLLHMERAGADVRLTIDLGLQRVAEEAMGGAVGAAVALDPRTGDVLALVSNPTFDAELSEEGWAALREDPRSPLLNRATQGLYTPGSTFKTVTIAAALEHRVVAPDDAVECDEEVMVGGIRITSQNEPPGGRSETVADAYAYSCNTYFAELGVEVGRDRLVRMAEALGLTSRVPFALPTAGGQVSNTRAFVSSDEGLAVTAFGQGELQMTPLHLALVAAAVANDGLVPRPRLLLSEGPRTWRRAMSVETARSLAAMMEQGVEAGWGSTAAIAGVRVAGKTGSAEVAEGESSHALFIAFAPVDDPQIAVAVVKERAGSGSREAGPVARAIIEAWLASRTER